MRSGYIFKNDANIKLVGAGRRFDMSDTKPKFSFLTNFYMCLALSAIILSPIEYLMVHSKKSFIPVSNWAMAICAVLVFVGLLFYANKRCSSERLTYFQGLQFVTHFMRAGWMYISLVLVSLALVILVPLSVLLSIFGDVTNAIEQLYNFLISLSAKYDVRAIAEEMNEAVLAENGTLESIACKVTADLNLRHQYSDPGQQVRAQLGILGENMIRIDGFFGGWNSEKIESEVRRSHAIREEYWLDQLRRLDIWPLLFVCGANHIGPFSDLLRSVGFDVELSDIDWAPQARLGEKKK
jgi:hypothetical protein